MDVNLYLIAAGAVGGAIGFTIRGCEVETLARARGELKARFSALSNTNARLQDEIIDLKEQLRMAASRQEAATVLVTGIGAVLRNYASTMNAISGKADDHD